MCACLPALVPFFERSFSNKFSLGSYFSRFQRFLSRSRASTDRAQSHTLQSPSSLSYRGGIKVDRDFDLVVVKGDRAPLKGGDHSVTTDYCEVGDDSHLHSGFAYNRDIEGESW